jgi:hypothetical protein
MKTQNFKTHGRLVTGYHKILYPMLLAGLIGSCINLSHLVQMEIAMLPA